MSNPLEDIEKADVIFAIGTNMTECHPVAATRLKRAVARGAKLIVADPRRIELAEIADLYLPLRVGSDVALLLAMAQVIAREGLVDQDFIEQRTQGAEAFLEHVTRFSPEWAETITGVPAANIEAAAKCYGRTKRGAIYYTLGITEHVCGVDNVQSLCNLALMTGNIGRPGTGINPMRGQNNVQGVGDVGAIPAFYPGFQAVHKPECQSKFERAYGREMDTTKGITKIKAMQLAGAGELHAMLICGENTVVSDPDRNHSERALRGLDHLVVVDIFENETTALADVVLPASAWAETDGAVTNTERRVQRLRAAVPPQGEARPDWWIIAQLAQRCGFDGFDYDSPQQVFDELCSLSPIYAGLDWAKLERGEYQWPVPHDGHPGTPILHRDEFVIGRGLFNLVEYRDPAEVIDADYPVWLTTGRRLESYHTHTQTGRSAGIAYLLPEEKLEVHPEDLRAWGLSDGDRCRVASRRGAVEVRVEANPTSPRGTVFCSFSFSDVAVNCLTGSGYDPVTDTGEVKVCAVRIDGISQLPSLTPAE